jgi:trans-aconitate 2-methyltransferase
MTDWNPALYTRFEEERTRPAAELLARVPLQSPRRTVDLGCGPGNSTELLVRRYPQARTLGVDNSQAMLKSARERLPTTEFACGDITDWSASEPVDLIYANAALQWVPDHAQLLPRLLRMLAPGGVLAVQMPDNLDEPSHRLMRETAAQAPFASHIGDAYRLRSRILDVRAYYDLLVAQPGVAGVDVWHTVYYHRMADAAAIVQWLRATGLKVFVEALPPELQAEYLAAYERRIAQAYPARADGSRLLAFPRLFFVARCLA